MSKRFTVSANNEIVAATNNGNQLRYCIDLAMRECAVYRYDGEVSDDVLIGLVMHANITFPNIHGSDSVVTLEISE